MKVSQSMTVQSEKIWYFAKVFGTLFHFPGSRILYSLLGVSETISHARSINRGFIGRYGMSGYE